MTLPSIAGGAAAYTVEVDILDPQPGDAIGLAFDFDAMGTVLNRLYDIDDDYRRYEIEAAQAAAAAEGRSGATGAAASTAALKRASKALVVPKSTVAGGSAAAGTKTATKLRGTLTGGGDKGSGLRSAVDAASSASRIRATMARAALMLRCDIISYDPALMATRGLEGRVHREELHVSRSRVKMAGDGDGNPLSPPSPLASSMAHVGGLRRRSVSSVIAPSRTTASDASDNDLQHDASQGGLSQSSGPIHARHPPALGSRGRSSSTVVAPRHRAVITTFIPGSGRATGGEWAQQHVQTQQQLAAAISLPASVGWLTATALSRLKVVLTADATLQDVVTVLRGLRFVNRLPYEDRVGSGQQDGEEGGGMTATEAKPIAPTGGASNSPIAPLPPCCTPRRFRIRVAPMVAMFDGVVTVLPPALRVIFGPPPQPPPAAANDRQAEGCRTVSKEVEEEVHTAAAVTGDTYFAAPSDGFVTHEGCDTVPHSSVFVFPDAHRPHQDVVVPASRVVEPTTSAAQQGVVHNASSEVAKETTKAPTAATRMVPPNSHDTSSYSDDDDFEIDDAPLPPPTAAAAAATSATDHDPTAAPPTTRSSASSSFSFDDPISDPTEGGLWDPRFELHGVGFTPASVAAARLTIAFKRGCCSGDKLWIDTTLLSRFIAALRDVVIHGHARRAVSSSMPMPSGTETTTACAAGTPDHTIVVLEETVEWIGEVSRHSDAAAATARVSPPRDATAAATTSQEGGDLGDSSVKAPPAASAAADQVGDPQPRVSKRLSVTPYPSDFAFSPLRRTLLQAETSMPPESPLASLFVGGDADGAPGEQSPAGAAGSPDRPASASAKAAGGRPPSGGSGRPARAAGIWAQQMQPEAPSTALHLPVTAHLSHFPSMSALARQGGSGSASSSPASASTSGTGGGFGLVRALSKLAAMRSRANVNSAKKRFQTPPVPFAAPWDVVQGGIASVEIDLLLWFASLIAHWEWEVHETIAVGGASAGAASSSADWFRHAWRHLALSDTLGKLSSAILRSLKFTAASPFPQGLNAARVVECSVDIVLAAPATASGGGGSDILERGGGPPPIVDAASPIATASAHRVIHSALETTANSGDVTSTTSFPASSSVSHPSQPNGVKTSSQRDPAVSAAALPPTFTAVRATLESPAIRVTRPIIAQPDSRACSVKVITFKGWKTLPAPQLNLEGLLLGSRRQDGDLVVSSTGTTTTAASPIPMTVIDDAGNVSVFYPRPIVRSVRLEFVDRARGSDAVGLCHPLVEVDELSGAVYVYANASAREAHSRQDRVEVGMMRYVKPLLSGVTVVEDYLSSHNDSNDSHHDDGAESLPLTAAFRYLDGGPAVLLGNSVSGGGTPTSSNTGANDRRALVVELHAVPITGEGSAAAPQLASPSHRMALAYAISLDQAAEVVLNALAVDLDEQSLEAAGTAAGGPSSPNPGEGMVEAPQIAAGSPAGKPAVGAASSTSPSLPAQDSSANAVGPPSPRPYDRRTLRATVVLAPPAAHPFESPAMSSVYYHCFGTSVDEPSEIIVSEAALPRNYRHRQCPLVWPVGHPMRIQEETEQPHHHGAPQLSPSHHTTTPSSAAAATMLPPRTVAACTVLVPRGQGSIQDNDTDYFDGGILTVAVEEGGCAGDSFRLLTMEEQRVHAAEYRFRVEQQAAARKQKRAAAAAGKLGGGGGGTPAAARASRHSTPLSPNGKGGVGAPSHSSTSSCDPQGQPWLPFLIETERVVASEYSPTTATIGHGSFTSAPASATISSPPKGSAAASQPPPPAPPSITCYRLYLHRVDDDVEDECRSPTAGDRQQPRANRATTTAAQDKSVDNNDIDDSDRPRRRRKIGTMEVVTATPGVSSSSSAPNPSSSSAAAAAVSSSSPVHSPLSPLIVAAPAACHLTDYLRITFDSGENEKDRLISQSLATYVLNCVGYYSKADGIKGGERHVKLTFTDGQNPILGEATVNVEVSPPVIFVPSGRLDVNIPVGMMGGPVTTKVQVLLKKDEPWTKGFLEVRIIDPRDSAVEWLSVNYNASSACLFDVAADGTVTDGSGLMFGKLLEASAARVAVMFTSSCKATQRTVDQWLKCILYGSVECSTTTTSSSGGTTLALAPSSGPSGGNNATSSGGAAASNSGGKGGAAGVAAAQGAATLSASPLPPRTVLVTAGHFTSESQYGDLNAVRAMSSVQIDVKVISKK